MVLSHTLHLPLRALLTWCTVCGTGAGVSFSDLTEHQLLSWLARAKPTFQELLAKSSLGFAHLPTARLLRELTRRADLAAALKETGLGVGTDFSCKEDESPRDAGCQVREGGREGGRERESTLPESCGH